MLSINFTSDIYYYFYYTKAPSMTITIGQTLFYTLALLDKVEYMTIHEIKVFYRDI